MKSKMMLILSFGFVLISTTCSLNNPLENPTPTPDVIGPIPSEKATLSLSQEQTQLLQEQGYFPVFEPADCKFEVPVGFQTNCGFLIVPEDRLEPGDRQVRMHVVIFKSRSETPKPDPLIYLTGGGGGNELDHTIRYLDNGKDAILEERDFIMYNQRGNKYNSPYLECRRESDMMLSSVTGGFTEDEQETTILDFFTSCRDKYLDEGIDLNLYNTAVNAEDLNDLRIALGYEEINIYGTSYGSGLALAVLRDFSDHIRSAIIDSVYPPQVQFYSEYGTNAHNTFQRIFAACERDETCAEKYPEIEALMYQVADELKFSSTFTKLQ